MERSTGEGNGWKEVKFINIILSWNRIEVLSEALLRGNFWVGLGCSVVMMSMWIMLQHDCFQWFLWWKSITNSVCLQLAGSATAKSYPFTLCAAGINWNSVKSIYFSYEFLFQDRSSFILSALVSTREGSGATATSQPSLASPLVVPIEESEWGSKYPEREIRGLVQYCHIRREMPGKVEEHLWHDLKDTFVDTSLWHTKTCLSFEDCVWRSQPPSSPHMLCEFNRGTQAMQKHDATCGAKEGALLRREGQKQLDLVEPSS